ncbi:MAG: hypothetical protein Q4P15_05460 [Propionibacteriaceae bacterium]|nr:hypothetical protein [Propionibacteriaceae bacterium]
MSEHNESDTSTAEAEAQQQRTDRVQTEERLTMDGGDMAEAIDQEHDQKVDPSNESRYEDDVDEALPGNAS